MRFAADENFDGRILNGLCARMPDLDIVHVQDTEMYQSPDDKLLAWLAEEGRILLTHDVRTCHALSSSVCVPGCESLV
jgi:hypothetical protein